MPEPRKKPTIFDISRLAGASASTVSAALSGTWRDRRISEATALRIQEIAAAEGYFPNMQARGLRRAQSGLVGMIMPVHDNRFFSSMSQSFEAHARIRGLCPVIVSTLRDPAEEVRTVETLISYAIESLFIVGATNPDPLEVMCRAAGLRHVYVDLPGRGAPSVVSNNRHGAELLTRAILERMPASDDPARALPYLLGGDASDHASAQRIEAFRAVAAAQFGPLPEANVIACGYAPGRASREVAALCDRLGGLPAGLFVNSLTVFEGVVGHLVTLPPEAFAGTAIGCYDYDPFAAFLQFPVHMVRQNADGLIARAFGLLDSDQRAPVVIEVEPELIAPRTIYKGPFSELG